MPIFTSRVLYRSPVIFKFQQAVATDISVEVVRVGDKLLHVPLFPSNTVQQ